MTYNYNLLFDIYIPLGAGSLMLIAIIFRYIQLNSSARHH